MADWLGVALYQQGKYREALDHFRRALAGANTEDARKHCADNIRFCEQEISTVKDVKNANGDLEA
jgi:tetratricopeptide (TPR) repeat protein